MDNFGKDLYLYFGCILAITFIVSLIIGGIAGAALGALIR